MSKNTPPAENPVSLLNSTLLVPRTIPDQAPPSVRTSDIALSTDHPRQEFALGSISVVYEIDRAGTVQFSCYPTSKKDRIAASAPTANSALVDISKTESLVQLKLGSDSGPGGFAQGRTLRGAPSTKGLRLESQQVTRTAEHVKVCTTLRNKENLVCHQHLDWDEGASFFTLSTTIENHSTGDQSVEMLSSFCLGGITPFHPEDAPNRLKAHRFRSAWSAEGRHEALFLEDLHLERSWLGWSKRVERFGQVGSLPVRGFFPFVAIEDTEEKVLWGVQLAHPGSWQMEIERENNKVSISGGLADRELGHWSKTLSPGAGFTTPQAIVATVVGDIDDLCHALTSAQAVAVLNQPAIERDLPIVFNEWCSSWGEPTEVEVLKVARRLAQTGTRYLVIDDGWAWKPLPGHQHNGDWNVDTKKFPQGLKPVCDAIRDLGLVPGLWFEMEVCTETSDAFRLVQHQLWRDGRVLQVGTRRFWDFRDPFTIEYLSEKLIHRLKTDGFGYLKVDYNETIPIGCDGSESLGEGLRQHLDAVQDFFRRIRRELPDLVIENCSSGGHRLEPSMMALTAMGSSSDAHEPVEIPIIAANLHRLIIPQQNQIWAVLHQHDSLQRIRYSLSATFLGRMCISGDIANLSTEQFSELCKAQDFYARIAPILRDGKSRLHRSINRSWRHPEGWQTLIRTSPDEQRLLVVLHCFAEVSPFEIAIPLPDGKWELDTHYCLPEFQIIDQCLTIQDASPFSGSGAIFIRA